PGSPKSGLFRARDALAKRLSSEKSALPTESGASPGRISTGCYANKRVVAALAARLGRPPQQVGIGALQQAARAELLADSARRGPGRPAATP
ncbi:MAG: hypothetical protein ACOY9B_08575, partial [Pseudomonadota bacterium]